MFRKTKFIKAQLLLCAAFLASALSASAGIVNTGKSYVIPLNNNWLFGGVFKEAYYNPGFDDSGFEKITIPHCVNKLSWQNWDVNGWQYVYGYRNHFPMPVIGKEQRVILHFDGVMVGAAPSINGHRLPSHLGGYLPFEYDVTPYIQNENVLTVAVDSRWSNVPPQGAEMGPKRIDYLEPGGIHRSVSIRIVPQTYIKDVYCIPSDALEKAKKLEVKTTLDTDKVLKGDYRILISLEDGGKCIASASREFKPQKGTMELSASITDLRDIVLWDIDNPKLYDVKVSLERNGEIIQATNTRIGFRTAEFRLDGFYLNGRRLQIFGLNRHELYPYVGYAMPDRVMRKDAEILKYDYNCNFVRCSHYPQTEAFLDACDELGLLVWDEVPGWGYLGDEPWKELCQRDVAEMIVRDRNHPSIVIWGTRVNESPNDVELYKKTRAIAGELDSTRPTSGSMTSGTRKTWETTWSQDVFAYDDYHADPDGTVGIDEPVEGYPYMLAEAVGQFNYPKLKDFDCYYSRTHSISNLQAQALRHAEAHSKSAGNIRNCGVVAWCAFDYGSLVNSFKTVKTPGVSDVFRIPKFGATFYKSQCDPEKRITLEPDFSWSFTGKSPNGPGKNAVIFSNCEELRLYTDGSLYATLKPDASKLPNLKYPPFYVNLDFEEGKAPENLKIEGYIKGRKVIERLYSGDSEWDELRLEADDTELAGDGIDATRVSFWITDKYGNDFRPYGEGLVEFDIEGPGEIIGDSPFDLSANSGCGAVWVRTKPGETGEIVLRAKSGKYGIQKVTINVK